MRIAEEREIASEGLSGLYESVGWSAYTNDLDRLVNGTAGSDLVLTAREADGRLCGLVRTVSDGHTICYVQDLLVAPAWQGRGVGTILLDGVLEHYSDCDLFVLTTDLETTDAPGAAGFYRGAGWVPHQELGLQAFAWRRRRT